MRLTILPDIHLFTRTLTHRRRRRQPRRATASPSGAVRVRRLALGHLDTQLGGAGDQTSNLAATNQPALHPELHAPHIYIYTYIPMCIYMGYVCGCVFVYLHRSPGVLYSPSSLAPSVRPLINRVSHRRERWRRSTVLHPDWLGWEKLTTPALSSASTMEPIE